jgi:hypothetical protein
MKKIRSVEVAKALYAPLPAKDRAGIRAVGLQELIDLVQEVKALVDMKQSCIECSDGWVVRVKNPVEGTDPLRIYVNPRSMKNGMSVAGLLGDCAVAKQRETAEELASCIDSAQAVNTKTGESSPLDVEVVRFVDVVEGVLVATLERLSPIMEGVAILAAADLAIEKTGDAPEDVGDLLAKIFATKKSGSMKA